MRLIQFRFSHNCVKVRRALDFKRLAYDTREISPLNREEAIAASGQDKVPILVDGERSIWDSTAILRHLEQSYPERPLLPDDPARQADCWLIEDWADQALMDLTRRMAYWHRIHVTPDVLCHRLFPEARGLKRWVMFKRARRFILDRALIASSRFNAALLVLCPPAASSASARRLPWPWLRPRRSAAGHASSPESPACR